MSTLVILRNQPSGQNLVESTKGVFKNQVSCIGFSIFQIGVSVYTEWGLVETSESKTLYSNGLKLERIVTDSKSERRKERKEKKEKRKLKKEKHEKSRKHSSKKVSDESDQSGLTEELEEPQSQLGYLSDGSQNSKKRKRDDSPPAVESLVKVAAAPVAGNPLRIRLIFKKPKEAVPTLPQEDPVCSTSVAKPLGHQDVVANSAPISEVSEPDENLPSTSAAAIVETIKSKKHKPSKEERYNALFDDLTPSSICFAAGDSLLKDDEWLFGKKKQGNVNPKAVVKIDEDMSMSLHRSSDSSWPKAQFLSDVGISSLPFTVPF